jgi:serine/threonine protein kinase/Leucine-rich repeat (LRR) protein
MRCSSRVESTFFAALEQPTAAARERYLSAAYADDESLKLAVDRLLRAHLDADSRFLHPAPARRLAALDDSISCAGPEQPDDRVGNYHLIEELGHGGFGVVWRAKQERPFRREVALKIIKLGMDTRDVVARFEQERQALAVMDHPHIAKVFDAGATPTGRPFFAMELVPGVKITDYCNAQRLTVSKRLVLFCEVCSAVQHAHQKGIIHRDLKPSNILITDEHGTPVPKIIDFGVAKATAQRLTDRTIFTRAEQIIGTPRYMSPEQADGSGLDIDTRSDIFSLGVLLFELLTGHTPGGSSCPARNTRDALYERDAPRMSSLLGTVDPGTLAKVAAERGIDPPKLIARLRGDLDWIVIKALEHERARRFGTASGLAADIRRHLANEPVNARPPTCRDRMRKLVRRNKPAVAAVAAVLTVLFIGMSMTAWQAIRAQAALAELRGAAPAFIEQARALTNMERFDDAVAKLDHAIKLRPTDPNYLITKADLLQCQLRLPEASAVYRAALRVGPGNARAFANYTLCEELLADARREAAAGGTINRNPHEKLALVFSRAAIARLYAAMQQEQRSAAELMPIARRLGEESSLLLKSWTARLSGLPIGPDRPLAQRLTQRPDGLLALDLSRTTVSDLTLLEGMPLGELDCEGCEYLGELEFVRTLPLRRLNVAATSVHELNALAALPALEELAISGSKVITLEPLRGLRLKKLRLEKLAVQDLGPLAGMPLEELVINQTHVTDLSPLADLPLRHLEMDSIPALDFRPIAKLPLEFLSMQGTRAINLLFLQEMPLKQLFLAGASTANFGVLNDIATLEDLVLPVFYGTRSHPDFAALLALRSHRGLRQIGMETTADPHLRRLTRPSEFWPDWERRAAVVHRFMEIDNDVEVTLNVLPDGTWDLAARERHGDSSTADFSFLAGAPITNLALQNLRVRELAPLRGMKLKRLSLAETTVENLAPLQGMPLEDLDLDASNVTDLSPLQGMKLKRLCIDRTGVFDISPLRGMQLEQLWMGTTKVTDLTPLAGMPLKLLHIDDCPRLFDVSPLVNVPTLEHLWLPKTARNVESLRALKQLKYISLQYDGTAQRPLHTAKQFWSMQTPATESGLASQKRFEELETLLRSRLSQGGSTEEWIDYMRLAIVLLSRGDTNAYRATRTEMQRRLKHVAYPETLFIASLAPTTQAEMDDYRALVEWGNDRRALEPGNIAYGLSFYRLGEFDRAANPLRDVKGDNHHRSTFACASAALAMVHYQQSDLLSAFAELNEAKSCIAVGRDKDDPWEEWLAAELLIKEAGKLLGVDRRK